MNWDMIGHEWAVSLLHSHLIEQRVRHAYLITGPPSIGKRTLALRFLQAMACIDPPRDGEFCAKCRACNMISRMVHPDLHFVATEEDERSIKVDQIRALRAKLSLSPYEGDRRMALIDGFHQATDQAANALLKTLEEPPPQVVMILTALSAESLLPTIVSRCEVISLRPLPINTLEKHLISKGEDKEHAQLLASVSGGRPGYALRIIDNPDLLERRTKLLDEMRDLIRSGRAERFGYVESWHEGFRRRSVSSEEQRKECLEFLEVWLSYWRDIMVVGFGSESAIGNPDRRDEIDILSNQLTEHQTMRTIHAIQDTINAVDSNANIRLALETLMLDFPTIEFQSS